MIEIGNKMKTWYEEPINVKNEIIKKANLAKDSNNNVSIETLKEICRSHGREYDNSLYTLVMR